MAEAGSLNLNEGARTRLLRQVIKHRSEALQARGEWLEKRVDRFKRFHADPSMRPMGPWPDAPRLFIPISRSVTERLQAEFFQSLFGDPQAIQLIPFGEEDVEKSELATKFLRWALKPPILNFDHIANMALQDALVDSAAVIRVAPWNPPWQATEEGNRRHFDTTIRMELVDQANLLVAPHAQSLQFPDCEYIHQEFFLRPDHLIRMRGQQGMQAFDIPPFEDLKRNQELTERQQEEQEREGISSPSGAAITDRIMLVESYERFQPAKGEPEEDVVVSWFTDTGSRSVSEGEAGHLARVVKVTDIYPEMTRPTWPYFDISVWPQPRQWRGMNVMDRIAPLQDIINRMHEQMINYGDVSILPHFFVNVALVGDIPDIRNTRPGEGIAVNDVNGIREAGGRSMNRHFSEIINLMQGQVERDTSVTDFSLGRASDRPNAPQTASATLALLQEGRRSFAFQTQHLAQQFEAALSFYFAAWQDRFPTAREVRLDDQIQFLRSLPPDLNEEELSIVDRLLEPESPIFPVSQQITKDELSGTFDVKLLIRPDAASDQQSLFTAIQALGPTLLQFYPTGYWELWDRLFGMLKQKGFEQIWPKEIADQMTQNAFLGLQLQNEALEMQLMQATLQKAQMLQMAQQPGLGMMQQGQEPQQGEVPEEQMMQQNGALQPEGAAF